MIDSAEVARTASLAARPKPRRALAVVHAIIVLGILSVVGLVGYVLVLDVQDGLREAGGSGQEPYEVNEPGFRFTLPDTPEVETVDDPEFPGTTGTAWVIDRHDSLLRVIAIDFGAPVNVDVATGGFTGIVNGLAARSNGRVVTTESFVDGDVFRHRATVAAEETLYVEGVAGGTVLIVVVGATSAGPPPAGYDDVVDSIELSSRF
jgi:hypothetical protein